MGLVLSLLKWLCRHKSKKEDRAKKTESISSNRVPLLQAPPISSSECAASRKESSAGLVAFIPYSSSEEDDQSTDQNLVPRQKSPEILQQVHDVIINIPALTHSLRNTIAVIDPSDSGIYVDTGPASLDVKIPEDGPFDDDWKEGYSEEEEQTTTIKCIVAEEKWIKHYSSFHRILLVGEGDFSFSVSLAMAFGSASNIVATSLDTEDFLRSNYRHAMKNIQTLINRGCRILHGIDATEMANNLLLKGIRFDRIIYNFPYAGLFKDLSRKSQLRRHRRLIHGYFANAKEMISEVGEIHVTHKTNGFHAEWKIEQMASQRGLKLIEAVPFSCTDYPGYRTKYGFGGDDCFNYKPSRTYKFGIKKRGILNN